MQRRALSVFLLIGFQAMLFAGCAQPGTRPSPFTSRRPPIRTDSPSEVVNSSSELHRNLTNQSPLSTQLEPSPSGSGSVARQADEVGVPVAAREKSPSSVSDFVPVNAEIPIEQTQPVVQQQANYQTDTQLRSLFEDEQLDDEPLELKETPTQGVVTDRAPKPDPTPPDQYPMGDLPAEEKTFVSPEPVQRASSSTSINLSSPSPVASGTSGPPNDALGQVTGVSDPDLAQTVEIDYLKICPGAEGTTQALITELNSRNTRKMIDALSDLGNRGSESAAAVPAIRETLNHNEPRIRLNGAQCLFKVTGNQGDALPVLYHGLQHSDAEVRAIAITMLQTMPPSDEMAGHLTLSLQDQNAFVRIHAAELLGRFPSHANYSVSVLLADMLSTDPSTRHLATYVVGELRPQSEHITPALAVRLSDTDSQVRSSAAFALGRLGARSADYLGNLEKLQTDPVAEVRESANTAMREIRANRN